MIDASLIREQRRGRRMAMPPAERRDFLRTQQTCRVATVGPDGSQHTSGLWFVWDGSGLWLNTIVKSQRWANLQRDPRVSVLVDAGEDYNELRGVEMLGRVQPVGTAPRLAAPDQTLEAAKRLFGEKYAEGSFVPDGAHAWLCLVPEKIVSWDFRRIAE